MSLEKFYVVIPAYEPDEKLLGVVGDIVSAENFKIVIVNDGSGTDKQSIFNTVAKSAEVLVHPVNRGKGAAIKTALEYIRNKTEGTDERCGIVVADADGQHKINDIKRVAQALSENEDKLIMGCRKFTGNIPARSKFGNEITKKVFSLASGVKVSDTQTGLRGFSSELIPFLLEVSGDRYEYEMNMLLECAKEKIQFFEVPIETVYIDSNESSHFNPIKDSVRIYKDILKFSCSSLLSFFVDYILYSVLLLLTDNLKVSNIGARVVSSCFNFTMNKRYVFRSKESILKTAVKYFALAACILAANTVLLELCTSYLIHNRFIAKILIEILLFFISWTVQKSFVFKKRKD